MRPSLSRLGFFYGKKSGRRLLISVINLTLGQTQYVYLTVKENLTTPSLNYLFRFVQRTTNAEIKFVKLNGDDVSSYKDRYSKFQFNVTALFGSGEIGEYYYYIYEQASTTNTNLANTGKLLEQGIMRLNPAANDVFSFTGYQTNNIFTAK